MKTNYLRKLRVELEEFQARQSEIDDIINDYSQLYDDAKSTGKTDDEVIEMLGDPKQIAYDLLDTLKLKKEKGVKNKIIALTPFLSVIIFMVLGVVYDLWHPGWLVFLMIPITAILFTTRLKDGIIALTPFISVVVYMILGFGFQLWHPGWLIFFLIPVTAILLSTRFTEIPVALSPFVAVILFILMGTYYDLWNPGWLVFLLIPMLGILHGKHLGKIIIFELSFVIAIAFYLYMGYIYGSWTYGALGFMLPVVVGIAFGEITITGWDGFTGKHGKKALIMFSTIILCIAAFLTLGFVLSGWGWAWQVFLAIPVMGIVISGKFKFTAISPFVAVVLFFSIGYFFNAFQLSWLAFLIIPMSGIIENA
jgi:uncharacterized membrane protein